MCNEPTGHAISPTPRWAKVALIGAFLVLFVGMYLSFMDWHRWVGGGLLVAGLAVIGGALVWSERDFKRAERG